MSVSVPVAGSANSGDYEVRVTSASGATRTVEFALTSPNGVGSLSLKVAPLTIDPGTQTLLRNLTKKTSSESPTMPSWPSGAGSRMRSTATSRIASPSR